MGFKIDFGSVYAAAALLFLFLLGCAGPEKKPQAAAPIPLGEIATRSGFRPFDFRGDVFKPGALVRIGTDGDPAPSPAGQLQQCLGAGGADAPLNIERGEGPRSLSSLADRGARVDLDLLERILPVRFGLSARSAHGVMMRASRTASESIPSARLEAWLSTHWSRLSDACRNALGDPGQAILNEVLSADRGFELHFLKADFNEIDLSSVPLQSLIASGAEAAGARIERKRLTFTAPLPIGYTLYRSCRFFDPARLAEDSYRSCVRRLSPPFQVQLSKESAGLLRDRYTSILEGEGAPAAKEVDRLNAIVDFLLAIDPESGHGWYYRGAVRRWMQGGDRSGAGHLESHDPFQTYLKNVEKLPRKISSRPSGCADDAIGYCPERTALVSNLLAEDFYRIAQNRPKEQRKGDLCRTFKYAEAALALRAEGGLKDPPQVTPPDDLIEKALAQMVNLRLGSCTG